MIVKRSYRASWWGWKKRVKKLSWNSTLKNLRLWHPVLSLHGKEMDKKYKNDRFFSWTPKSLWTMASAMKFPCKKSSDRPRQHIKMRGITFPANVRTVKARVFPEVMYRYESRTIKKAEQWRIDDFNLWPWKTLESPLDSKEIKSIHPKGNLP